MPGCVVWPPSREDPGAGQQKHQYWVQCYSGGRWTTWESYRLRGNAIRAVKRLQKNSRLNFPWRVWREYNEGLDDYF